MKTGSYNYSGGELLWEAEPGGELLQGVVRVSTSKPLLIGRTDVSIENAILVKTPENELVLVSIRGQREDEYGDVSNLSVTDNDLWHGALLMLTEVVLSVILEEGENEGN